MKIAVYPGSFDPITNGHLDVLRRASKVFDKVIVLVSVNSEKKATFTPSERVKMIKEATKDYKNVSVDSTDELTVRYARNAGATCLIRGLRAVTDFEYEFKLAEANHFIDPDIDIVFFMSTVQNSYISSSMVNEFQSNGVDISKLVPTSVVDAYKNK